MIKDENKPDTLGSPVAVKKMLTEGIQENDIEKIYEFQYEMLIMRYENSDKIRCDCLLTGTFCSKVKHKNLVELHGVLKSPFSLVMESSHTAIFSGCFLKTLCLICWV
jgi:hypothetical protein